MSGARHLIPSDEAHWQGVERCWASVQQFAPKRERASWWLVLAGLVMVAFAVGVVL